MAGTVRKRSWTNRKGETKTAWTANYPDQTGAWHLKTFATKKAADAWLAQTKVEVHGGVHTPDRNSLTVAEAAQLWLRRGERAGLERGSLRTYATSVDRHIVPYIGKVRLSRLTAPMVVEFCDQLLETYSRKRARFALSHLRSIITEMVRRGLVAHNVALAVRVEVRRRERAKLVVGRDVPSPAEVTRLLAGAGGWWRPMLVLAAFTGMRASELRGLTWTAIDLDKKLIHVRQRADQWGTIGRPKSAAGERAIPLADVVVEALRSWRQVRPAVGAGLVFPGPRGKPRGHPMLLLRFRAEQCDAGLVDEAGTPKYGFHMLRHFFASWAISRNFQAKRLQEMLGHSSITMTYDTYGHLFPAEADDQVRMSEGARAVLGSHSDIGPT